MRSLCMPGIAAILIAASSFSLPSCKGSVDSNTPIDKAAPLVADTIQKVKIDSLAQQINDVINSRKLKARKISYPAYNPKDSIGFIITEEHHGRISMNTHPDSNIVWPYFWIYKGDLIMVRLR